MPRAVFVQEERRPPSGGHARRRSRTDLALHVERGPARLLRIASVSPGDLTPQNARMPVSPTFSILHVLAPAPFGGLESVVRGLALGHHERGHRVRVAALTAEGESSHPLVSSLGESGVAGEAWPLGRRAYLAEARRVTEACRRWEPDVVHTHGYHADVVAGTAARSTGTAVATTVHGFLGGGWKNRLYEQLQRWAFRGFDAVVPVSRALAEELASDGVPRDRLHPIPNAWGRHVAFADRDEARRSLGLGSSDVPVIGWVGRLGPEKGLDVLLEALAGLTERDWRLVVVGAGRERGSLEELAASLGLSDRVRWLGFVEDAGRYFRAFDLFCLSSRTEGMPVVLFEAMAASVPIVATRVGGVVELLSEDAAWLCPPEDPEALRRVLADAIGDPDARRARLASARERLADRFDVETWLDRYEAVYREIARRPAAVGAGGAA